MNAKIIRYAAPTHKDFWDIHFKSELPIRLQPKRIFGTERSVRGELSRIEYYVSAIRDAQGRVVYDDLVLSESFEYVRNALGFALSRTQTITWYNEDDTTHAHRKVLTKVYDDDQLAEGTRRRRNVIDMGTTMIVGTLSAQPGGLAHAIDEGKAFFDRHVAEVASYIETSSRGLVDTSIPDDATEWLDSVLVSPGVSVRAYLVDWFNIWDI